MNKELKLPIYLDNGSTTQLDPRVLDKMLPYLKDAFGNPASRSHSFGWAAEQAVEEARNQIASCINCDPKEIIFTSGATEADNLAIKGAANFYAEKGKHLITIKTEHKAVLDTMREMERCGFEVSYLSPMADGLIDLEELKQHIRPDTILVSVMLVNNEIGVIQDIKKIGDICHERGIIFHTDAAQAVGKIKIDLNELNVDLMSMTAHKVYGPKGVGALYARRKPRIRLHAQMHGGGHERGMRSGTLPTHQIVGMGEAFYLSMLEIEKDNQRIKQMRDKLLQTCLSMDEVYLNGSLAHRVVHNLNLSFNFVEGESLIMALKDIAVSSGSACTSASLEPSYVLRALGRNDELAHSSIRFGFGRFTTEQEIDYVCQIIKEKINKLRELSPLWEMHLAGIDVANYNWA